MKTKNTHVIIIVWVLCHLLFIKPVLSVELSVSSKGESDQKNQTLEKNESDIDNEIKNARLRAATGSKSEISIQTEFNYNGGSLEKPFYKYRPRLAPGTVTELSTKISGNISAKYRFNKNNHLNFGTGLGVVNPGYPEQTTQIENPFLGYTYLANLFGLENIFSTSFTKYTAKQFVDEDKLNYSFYLYHVLLLPLQSSQWQLGGVLTFSTDVYFQATDDNQYSSHNSIGVSPFAEYAYSEKYSFRTVYRGIIFNSYRENFNKYYWQEATQSFGLGCSITRDVYLYPNVQWVWRDVNLQKTNIALSANINFF